MSDENEYTEGEKRAAALRNLATWEDNVAKGAADLERRRSDLLHYEECHQKDIARRDTARMELYALYAELAPPSPAQPLDELRSVPGAEEEVRDQIGAPVERPWTLASAFYDGYKGRKQVAPQHPVYMEQWLAGDYTRNGLTAEAVQRAHAELDEIDAASLGQAGVEHDSTPTVQPADLTVADLDAPEIPEGFTKWEGGEWTGSVGDLVEVMWSNGNIDHPQAADFVPWERSDYPDDVSVIAYRIIEAPAPEQDASDAINDLVDELVGGVTFSPDTVAMQTYMDGDQVVIREISAEQMYAPPPTDLWQQGYNDKLNGFDPSLAEDEYTKGYEARALIEREQAAANEQAKFFAEGMMADADRHAQDQRGIVGVLTGMFKREREDA